jgi:hypothetical protein
MKTCNVVVVYYIVFRLFENGSGIGAFIGNVNSPMDSTVLLSCKLQNIFK